MTTATMNNPNPTLTDYLSFASGQGINLERFVTHGGRLLEPADCSDLFAGITNLREKIGFLRGVHPRLGRQLEFLLEFFAADAAHPTETVRVVSEAVRNEATFALLYAMKDLDLVPDDMPGVGFLDDIAIAEIVLARHAEVFGRYCSAHGIDWATLQPESRN